VLSGDIDFVNSTTGNPCAPNQRSRCGDVATRVSALSPVGVQQVDGPGQVSRPDKRPRPPGAAGASCVPVACCGMAGADPFEPRPRSWALPRAPIRAVGVREAVRRCPQGSSESMWCR
jgi:hypothetical protein